jgi:hypothetical protein
MSFSKIQEQLWTGTEEIIIIIINVISIIIPFITFVQDIYNYMPETNHVYRVYSVKLQFVPHVVLFPVSNVLCASTLARTTVCVQCPASPSFFSSLISCFPAMLLRYWLNDYGMAPFAVISTCMNFSFTFHMRWISIMRSYTLDYYYYYYHHHHHNTEMTLTNRRQRWKCETKIDTLPNRKMVMMMMIMMMMIMMIHDVHEIWYFKAAILKKISVFWMLRHVVCWIITNVLEEPPAFVLNSISMKTPRSSATLTSYNPPGYTVTLPKRPQFKYF